MMCPLGSVPRAPEAPAHRRRPGGETVLLVDDEPAIRKYLCLLLRTGGYTVLEAGDGADAVRVGQAHRGTIDLLLTDVEMPGLGGRQLATVLKATRPGMRVLYVSGYPADAALGGAVADVLEKPFTPAGLAVKLRAVLDPRD
jgi:two-component system, cell cycle sensor histidine kinase and response regulator CckA